MYFHSFNRPEWIFFDLDDTLWDFASNSLRSLEYIFNETHIIREKFSSFEEFIDEYHIHNSRMWEEFAKGNVTSGFIKTERWRATLFPDSPPHNPPAECTEINDMYLSKLATYPYTVEGAIPLLRNLAKSKMIGIVSNGFTDTQYRKLNNSGLWKYITRVIVSDETGIQKPDPRIFDYAVAETGATGIPVMVGDNPYTDILGALLAGWKAVWFNPAGKEFPFTNQDLKDKGIDPELYLGAARDMQEVGELITKSHTVN
ncbi:MAG: YjjG family noncanonical pyrimidine nucleotidase [Muribaculaceae bacterium]|nr:YjjG family noncanonical pyrimidine nucleotidase [Muribaculaceae bacterium]